jgi:hypothetical protein
MEEGIVELKALFWSVIVVGLLATGILLEVASDQMNNGRTNSTPGQRNICLTCDPRPNK